MNLIVGATGTLGSEICRLLSAQGASTRALVRGTSSPDRVGQLKRGGAQLVTGDLKDSASLQNACHGVDAVISTASSTHARQVGDSLDSVDRQGQLNLIDAAERAGAKHFVLISFPDAVIDFPLQRAKRAVEDRLRRSRVTHTILQPTFFMEVWLSPPLGFDPANGKAQIYGTGQNRISWISFRDVARFAVASLTSPPALNATVQLGGPDALSPLEVVGLAGQLTRKQIAVQHVPEEALRAQHGAADADPMQQTFAGLMLYYARGDVIDMTDAHRMFSVPPLKSVREYLQESVGVAAG
jgi:NADH dehydrogenase